MNIYSLKNGCREHKPRLEKYILKKLFHWWNKEECVT